MFATYSTKQKTLRTIVVRIIRILTNADVFYPKLVLQIVLHCDTT